jgi:hypothetical protein
MDDDEGDLERLERELGEIKETVTRKVNELMAMFRDEGRSDEEATVAAYVIIGRLQSKLM